MYQARHATTLGFSNTLLSKHAVGIHHTSCALEEITHGCRGTALSICFTGLTYQPLCCTSLPNALHSQRPHSCSRSQSEPDVVHTYIKPTIPALGCTSHTLFSLQTQKRLISHCIPYLCWNLCGIPAWQSNLAVDLILHCETGKKTQSRHDTCRFVEITSAHHLSCSHPFELHATRSPPLTQRFPACRPTQRQTGKPGLRLGL